MRCFCQAGSEQRPIGHSATSGSCFLVFSLGLPALMKAMRMGGVDVDTVLGLGHLAQVY